MRDPNFLVIGAQKCGTTWLAAMLRQHPEVFTPEQKELHFFDLRANYQRGLAWYREHFAGSEGHKAVGECTPNYLWVQEACPKSIPGLDLQVAQYEQLNDEIPRRVHEAFPDLRLLVVLRNPVDRAISSFRHHIRMRRIPPRRSILRVGGEHGILSMGFYTDQLLAWERYFPRDRLRVLIYEHDVQATPEETVRQVYAHVGVDPAFRPGRTERRFNRRASDAFMFARFYSPQLARTAFRWLPFLDRIAVPGMDVSRAERRVLESVYAGEVARLEEHLGVSLEVWRAGAST